MKNYTFSNVARAGVWGLLLGAGVGFAVGMLLAPEEGQKIRRRLAFQLENLSQRLGDYVDRFTSDGQGSEARQKGESLVADVEERARQIQDDMDQLLAKFPSKRSAASHR
jgi:gas vesicle protein